MKRIVMMMVLAGCGTEVHFAYRHILWVVHDDRPIAVPAEREVLLTGPGTRDMLFRSADRVLSLDYGRESSNVNALDEVPDSSWFEDPRRDHAREDGKLHALSDEEMRQGATLGEPPPQPPYVIQKGKGEGATFGFIVKDARGRKFALKLDPPGWSRMATSTEVVATRLVWSLGWHVPEMWLIDLKSSDLVLSPGATVKNELGRYVPLTPEHYRELLRKMPIDGERTIPATMSFWIPGKIVGAYSYYGKRGDDPNDFYRHEDRRDLRGYSVVCSWINNIDTQELNTLDSYVGKPGEGHLVHYQQDVGGSFGSRAVGPTAYWMGSDAYFSTSRVLLSLFTLGTVPKAWEGDVVERERARSIGRWPELGYFDSDHFDARGWKPLVYNPAFDRATTRDQYWGAKRVAAMSQSELRAAIDSGGYRAEVAERLFQVLWSRREKITRAFFSDVASLDHFHMEGARVCFDDLWEDAGLGGAGVYSARGGILDGKCVSLPSQRGYHVVELRVKRPGWRRFSPPVKVHLTNSQVVGVAR